MWHMTRDTGHVTHDMWHKTHDTWHIVWELHSLKISAPYLFWFGIDSVLNIFPQNISYLREAFQFFLLIKHEKKDSQNWTN